MATSSLIAWIFLLILFNSINCDLITNWQLSSNGFLPVSGLSSGCILSINYNNTDSIYIFGGSTDNIHSLNTIYKWNVNNNNDNSSFTQLTTQLPLNITCDQSITYNINNNIIYMVGVTTHPITKYGIIYTFNPITNTFQTKIPSMQTAIRSSCIVMDNRNNLLYSIGGININGTIINELQILNVVTNKWKKKTYITPIPINVSSSACWLSLDNTKLYTFGGKSLTPLQDIYRYNVVTNSWLFIGNLSKPKTGSKAVYINNYDKLLIIGGLNIDNEYIGEIELFNPINEQNYLLFESKIFIENINKYNGYLMSVVYLSEIYIWGVTNIDNNISKPLKTNLYTHLPTNNPLRIDTNLYVTLHPSISPIITNDIIGQIPNDNDIETEYVNNNNSTKRLLNKNITIIIAITSFVLIFCTIILILCIRIKNKTNDNKIDNNNNIKYEQTLRSRVQIESDPSDEIALNNISVEDLVKMASKDDINNNINIINDETQEINNMDLVIENDVNMISVVSNDNDSNNNDDISSMAMSENDTICARKGSDYILSNIDEKAEEIGDAFGIDNKELCDQLFETIESVKTTQLEMQQNNSNNNEIFPVRTNNMANHELAEGFDCDDDYNCKIRQINCNISDVMEANSNFEIDNSCIVYAMSVSEVQMEGLAIMRKQKKKKKKKKSNKYK